MILSRNNLDNRGNKMDNLDYFWIKLQKDSLIADLPKWYGGC